MATLNSAWTSIANFLRTVVVEIKEAPEGGDREHMAYCEFGDEDWVVETVP